MSSRRRLSFAHHLIPALSLPRSPLAAFIAMPQSKKKQIKRQKQLKNTKTKNQNKTVDLQDEKVRCQTSERQKPTLGVKKQHLEGHQKKQQQKECQRLFQKQCERQYTHTTHQKQKSTHKFKHCRVQSALTREDQQINSEFSFDAMRIVTPIATEQNIHHNLNTIVERARKTFQVYQEKLNKSKKELSHLKETNKFLQRKLQKIIGKKKK